MRTNPIYLLLILLVAGLSSSCASDSPDVIGGVGSEVQFAVADETRAAATSSILNTPGAKFAVCGDMKLASDNKAPMLMFKGTEVVRNTKGWSYEDIQYWFPKYEYSFVAVYPTTVLTADNSPEYSNSKLSFTYAMPFNEDGTVSIGSDVVVATHRRLYDWDLYSAEDIGSPVNFKFSHILSQINFSLEVNEVSMKSDEGFKIHKLEMSGFGTSASINVKPAPRQSNCWTDDSEFGLITAQEVKGRLAIEFADPIEIVNGSEVRMFDDNDAIIMLPQDFGENDEVQIGLTYSINDEVQTTQVSASLSNFKWQSGKSYNYKIKLELGEAKEVNMVISKSTIAPWNLVEDSNKVDAR